MKVEGDGIMRFLKVNRVEVIDPTGRAYVNMDATEVWLALQDGGHTLKVFLSGQAPQ